MKPETPAWVGITYLLYVAIVFTILFGGIGYAVFVLGHSGWWFAFAVFVAACTYKPWHWHALVTGVEPESATAASAR